MLLVAIQLASTGAMVGLIWFVQIVHYPLYQAVGTNAFSAYENAHTRLTAFVVGPVMAVETGTAVAIVAVGVPGVRSSLAVAGLMLILGIHATTALLQVPAHRELCQGYDDRVARWLVRSNWLRTVGWSARLVIAVMMVVAASHAA